MDTTYSNAAEYFKQHRYACASNLPFSGCLYSVIKGMPTCIHSKLCSYIGEHKMKFSDTYGVNEARDYWHIQQMMSNVRM